MGQAALIHSLIRKYLEHAESGEHVVKAPQIPCPADPLLAAVVSDTHMLRLPQVPGAVLLPARKKLDSYVGENENLIAFP